MVKGIFCLAAAAMLVLSVPCTAEGKEKGDGMNLENNWKLVCHEDFINPKALDRWHIEGAGELSLTNGNALQITNRLMEIEGVETDQSVAWYRKPVWGDLRVEMECRAEEKSRVIVFFNARAVNEKEDIFSWERPVASYADYAYEPRLELYSMGLLRSDQTGLNLRYLGKDIPREWIEMMPYHPRVHPERYLSETELEQALEQVGIDALPESDGDRREVTGKPEFRELLAEHIGNWSQVNRSFQEASIIAEHSADEPVFSDPDRWYDVIIEVIDNRIKVQVDGQTIIDHKDTPREERPLKGGFLGLRNFRGTTVWYRDLKIYKLDSGSQD